MQLASDLWIEGAYYVDFDHLGQLRIVGPNNHLHFGSVGITKSDIEIGKISVANGLLHVQVKLSKNQIDLDDPALGHIRKVRQYVEPNARRNLKPLSFTQIMRKFPYALSANYIGFVDDDKANELTFRRYYGDNWYGVTLKFPDTVSIKRLKSRRKTRVTSNKPIEFEIIASSSERVEPTIHKIISTREFPDLINSLAGREIAKLLKLTGAEATYLISYNKTSGFSFGSVFPRDWLESADLGTGDLTDEARLYMYHQALQNVDDSGRGWHEAVIGENVAEKVSEVDAIDDDINDLVSRSSKLSQELKKVFHLTRQIYINRTMIDVEPRFILGLKSIGLGSFSPVDREHLTRVAHYVLAEAESKELITFKKIPAVLRQTAETEFRASGNWRDSDNAFALVYPEIAPYDVNAVFYPQALAIIAKNAHYLRLDANRATDAMIKWREKKKLFKFRNSDGLSAYALALYEVTSSGETLKYKTLKINHTDEAYDLFYGEPEETDIQSFAKRLLNPNYFYTQSGPLIVGAGDGYKNYQYHGRVIWTKQTALIVAGLKGQLELHQKDWSAETKQLLRQALIVSGVANLNALINLGQVPELHVDISGHAKHFDDLERAEGPANVMQLWSTIGARRIVRELNAVYKEHSGLI
ncbi:MAG: hypothetical protein ACHQUB_00450 [Candidatus Saccharimonadia bacterium]